MDLLKDTASDLVGIYVGNLIIDTFQLIENYEVEVPRMDSKNIRITGQDERLGTLKFTVQKRQVRRLFEITSTDAWETGLELYAITERENLELTTADFSTGYKGFKQK